MTYPTEGEKGGGKGGGGGGSKSVEKKNTLYSRTTVKVLEAVSEGVTWGLWDRVNPKKSVYFDNVVLMNPDGSQNFEGVSIDERFGLDDQPYMAGFEETTASVDVSEVVEKASPVEVSFTGEFDAIRVTILIPSLTVLNSNNGNLVGGEIKFQVRYRANGGPWKVMGQSTITIEGKNTAPFEYSVRANIWDFMNTEGTSNSYDIQVTRITDDFTGDSTKSGDLIFQRYSKIIDQKFQYPNTAYIGTILDGYLFGDTVLSRTFDYGGLLLQVPSNYDPVTRTYTGLWDGTFKREWSDNPAWAIYELLVNNRWGLGRDISTADVNIWKLYEIAQYCDAVVASGDDMVFQGIPDGSGGFEPRFTHNSYITSRIEAYSIISLFVSVFQGMLYWGTGTVEFSQDSPEDPIALFTESNVIEGLFTRSGSSIKSKYSIINVTWENPDRDGLPEVEVVEDDEMIVRYGKRVRDVFAFACNSRGQARRYGLRLLENEKYGEMVLWQTGLDGARIRPGDIVKIQDPSFAGEMKSGKIVLVVEPLGNHRVTLDEPIDFSANGGVGFKLHAMLPDGTIEWLEIVAPDPLTAVVNCLGTFSTPPLVGATYIVEAQNLIPEEVRIVSVRPTDKHIFELSGVLYDSGKYDRIELGLHTPPPITSNYPTAERLPTPLNISFQELLYRNGPAVKSMVLLSWTAGNIAGDNLPDPRVTRFEVEWKDPFTEVTDWEPIPSGSLSSGVSLDILDTQFGTYEFRVRARDNKFRMSDWAESGQVLLNALTLPPDDVPSLSGYVTGETMNLEFTPVGNLDLERYEVRFAPKLSGVSWVEGQILTSGIPANARTATVAAGNGTYMIKAIDQQGDYSVNATYLISNIASIFEYNVIDSVLENDANWAGVHVDTIELEDTSGEPPVGLGTFSLYLMGGLPMAGWGVLENVITLEGGGSYASAGVYYFANPVDLSEVYNSRITYDMTVTALNKSIVMASWTTLASLANMSGTVEGEAQVVIQLSFSELDPTAADAAVGDDGDGIAIPTGNSLTGWTSWQNLVVNNHRARSYRFRLILASTNLDVTPLISDCSIIIDMPDRTVTNNAALTSSDSGDTAVLFTNHGGDFKGPAGSDAPTIAISVYSLAKDDYWTVTNDSVAGFTLNVYNAAGTRIAKAFSFIAKGYGTVQ